MSPKGVEVIGAPKDQGLKAMPKDNPPAKGETKLEGAPGAQGDSVHVPF